MKRTVFCALISATLASAATGQVVSNFTQGGAVSPTTVAGHYVYTRGGSPRTGFYWYWRHYTDQTTQTPFDIPLNGTTGVQTSTGTFFQPNYTAATSATTTFTNGATEADYSLSYLESAHFAPKLGDHQEASAMPAADGFVEFTITRNCICTVQTHGTYGFTHMVNVGFGSVIFGGGGPMTQTIQLGPGTYYIELAFSYTASRNMQTAQTTNWGSTSRTASMTVKIKPGGDGSGEGGGDS
jgi:hypothetical protein